MEPRRAEGVLHGQHPWREDREIDIAGAGSIAGRMQHQEDRRIGVVVADRTHHVEAAQVIFVRRVIAVPCHHIQRAVVDIRAPQMPLEFGDQAEVAFHIFIRRIRGQEITRIGQPVAANRAQIRQLEQCAEVLAHIACGLPIRQAHTEAHAAWQHRNFLRLHVQYAQLGFDMQAPGLRHQHQLAIGIAKPAAVHVGIRRIQVDAHAHCRFRAAIAGHGVEAIQKIHAGRRRWQRVPTQLFRGRRAAAEIVVECALFQQFKLAMQRRRTNAIQPTAAVGVAWRGERAAGQLLGIQPVRHLLR